MKRYRLSRTPRPKNAQENGAINLIDRLEAFKEFQVNILPALREDIKEGKTAEQIYSKYQAMAAARGISIAMTEVDSGKALAAIREILDRSGGRATEKHTIEHKFSKLRDEELDALLISRAKEVEDVGSDEEDS